MFFPTLDPATGKLLELTLTPMRIHKFRVQRANSEEADWLAVLLRRESAMPVERTPDLRLLIR